MSITAEQIQIVIVADNSGAKTAFKQTEDEAKASGGRAGDGFGSAFAGFLSAGIVQEGLGKLKDLLGDIVSQGQDADQTQALLKNALLDTHGATGQNIDSLEKLSVQLSGVTKYSDDTVKAVEQIAIRGKIPPGLFDAAVSSALDLSQATGVDASAAMNTLTKALDNPANAAGVLRKAHIALTDAQDTALKSAVKQGDTLKAQQIILSAVQGSYGGAAKAAGSTFAGQMDILHNKLENTEQEIGQRLLPVLGQFLSHVVDIAGQLVPFINWLGDHSFVLAALGAIIGTVLVAAFVQWAIAAGAAAVATIIATAPVLAIIAGIGLLIAAIVLVVQHWGDITSALGHFKDTLGSVAGAIGNFIGGAIGGLGNALQGLKQIAGDVFGAFWDIEKAPFNLMIGGINALIRGLDSIHFDIPDWVPGFGGKGFGINIPQIPQLASGGYIAGGGLAVVGERGPEMVNLPTGARVIPNGQSASASTGSITIIQQLDGRTLTRSVLQNMPGQYTLATGKRY